MLGSLSKRSEDPLRKNDISGSVWHKSFIQMVEYSSLMKELFAKVFFVHHSHLVIFSWRKSSVFWHVSASRMLVISWLCLLFEDGIFEASISGSIWQKAVNFLFKGKILSLLINIQSVNFLLSAQLQNVCFSYSESSAYAYTKGMVSVQCVTIQLWMHVGGY